MHLRAIGRLQTWRRFPVSKLLNIIFRMKSGPVLADGTESDAVQLVCCHDLREPPILTLLSVVIRFPGISRSDCSLKSALIGDFDCLTFHKYILYLTGNLNNSPHTKLLQIFEAVRNQYAYEFL